MLAKYPLVFFLLNYPSFKIAAAFFILSYTLIKKIDAWNSEIEKWKDDKEAIDDLKKFSWDVNPKFLFTLKYELQK